MNAVSPQRLPGSISVVVVEDEPLFRDLLVKALLGQVPGATVTGSFATGEIALEQLASIPIDILLSDIDLGRGMTGVELGIEVRRHFSARGVVLLSNLSQPELLTRIPTDVQGGWSYLLKRNISNIDQLGAALHSAAAGEITIDSEIIAGAEITRDGPMGCLTSRQIEVLAMVATGLSNQRVAEELHVGVRTVESSMSLILTQLGLSPDDGISPRVAAVLAYLGAYTDGRA
jgi:DNA-binding NarL/FixJ family response regulator